jgi:tetratricopeptide (TPR) repeat protein
MQAQMVKARAQRDMGDLSGATATFNELLTNARRTNNESQVATTIDDLARAFYLQEKYADAYDALKENCGVYEKRQARFDAGYCYANLGTVQWHLGGYAEAMTSFERARSIAEGPSGFPGLLGTVYGDVAEMELSRRNIPQSLKALEAAAASGDNDDLETVINLTVVRGLSAVYSGHPVEGVRLCRQAVETATAKGASPWLIGPAQVALAETLLAAGDYDAAADTAIRTQDTFAQTGQLVSSFRAWTIATLAFRALHDGPKSASSEKSMREAAAKLENALRPDAYLRFRARPDIVALTGRIDASH